MPAPYDPRAVANYVLHRRDHARVTLVKLHKLLYFADGWRIAFTGSSLYHEPLEAWEHGPVYPSVEQEFQDLGARPIERLATGFPADPFDSPYGPERSDQIARQLLDRIWESYGLLPTHELTRLVRQPGSPWIRARRERDNPPPRGVPVPPALMRAWFLDHLGLESVG